MKWKYNKGLWMWESGAFKIYNNKTDTGNHYRLYDGDDFVASFKKLSSAKEVARLIREG